MKPLLKLYSTRLDQITEHYPILHTDNERGCLVLVSLMLKRAGLQVISALDTEEALQILQDRPISLVISDITAARLNGMEFLERVRADPNGYGYYQPFMFLTARSDYDTRLEAVGKGIDFLAYKPILHHDLLANVRRVLQERSIPYLQMCGLLGDPNTILW